MPSGCCMATVIIFTALSIELAKIYKRLGVTIIDRGESFYQPLMPEIVKDLEAKGGLMLYSHTLISLSFYQLFVSRPPSRGGGQKDDVCERRSTHCCQI